MDVATAAAHCQGIAKRGQRLFGEAKTSSRAWPHAAAAPAPPAQRATSPNATCQAKCRAAPPRNRNNYLPFRQRRDSATIGNLRWRPSGPNCSSSCSAVNHLCIWRNPTTPRGRGRGCKQQVLRRDTLTQTTIVTTLVTTNNHAISGSSAAIVCVCLGGATRRNNQDA